MDRKAAQRRQAEATLRKRGIDFESKNDGCHLIVQSEVGRIDFWPGTGLFEIKETMERDRGLQNLLKIPLKPRVGVQSKPTRNADDESLRDRIAIAAMESMIKSDKRGEYSEDETARVAYEMADAMLEARAK